MSPLPLGLYQTSRKSPFLFQWEARDLSLTARTGQLGTLTRASDSGIASFLDSNGSVGLAARNAPRWHRDPTTGLFGLLLEGARTNLAVRSSEWDNAAWTNGGASATPNTTVAPDGTLTADTVARVASGGEARYQAPTFTGNGTKAVSVFVKQGTSAVVRFAVYDSTAALYRRQVDLTWTAGVPVLTSASGMGTIFPVIALGNGWYRIAFAADAVIAANVNFAPLVYPSQGGANGDTIIVWGAQVEDATFPSSYIPTAAATVTRSADAFSVPFNASAAQLAVSGVTLYDKIVVLRVGELCSILNMGNSDGGGSSCVTAGLNTTGVSGAFTNGTTQLASTVAMSLAVGDTVERLVTVTPAGSARCQASANGAAVVDGGSTTGQSWPAALTVQAVYLNEVVSPARVGDMVRQSVRIASGVQSMDFMRSA